MKRLILAVLATAWCSVALADPPQITASDKKCATVTLTTGAAYTAGNVVGSVTAAGASGVITIPSLVRVSPASVNALTAVLLSIELKFQEAHTEEFDISPFDTSPATSTFTDKVAPAVSAADALNMQVPIKLATASSLLGANGTVYGADQVSRVIKILDGIGRFVITTPGTPTFTAATGKLCAGVLQD